MVHEVQNTTPTGQSRTLADIGQALLKEFRKPKSESQYITEMKEIKKVQNEIVWDYNQRFKYVMGILTFHILDQQHQEWFIAGLLPHIHYSIDTKKVMSQPKELEIMMKLEAYPIGDGIGMAHVTVTSWLFTNSVVRNNKGKGKV
jgi:hypothetical protein